MTITEQPNAADLKLLYDRESIFALVLRERFARDKGDWDALAASYVPWARIRTTWFDGTPAGFASESRVLAENGRLARHVVVPAWVKIAGERALVESNAEIQHRELVHGVEADMVQYCRFFSRVQRTDEGWRLASFDGIYTRDYLTPVNPEEIIPLDWTALRKLRPSYRVWSYTLGLRGFDVSQDIPADDRPDLLATFYREAEEWLAATD